MANLPEGMREHYGRNIDKMPQILKAGEVPMSTAQLMKARLEQGAEFPDLWNCWYDTSDLVVYPKGNDKEVYVLLTVDNQDQMTANGRNALELIRPGNLALNYGAKLDKIGSLGRRGLVKVSRDKLTTGRHLTQEQALTETAWRILARHPDEVPKAFAEDESLLREYEERIRAKTGQSTNMAVYLGDSVPDEHTLKAWCVGGLGGGSDVGGRSGLDGGSGRLVGIAPEALSAPGRWQKVRTYTPDQVRETLEELGFSDLSETLIEKLNQRE